LFPYARVGRASPLHNFILENFWTKVGLKVLLQFLVLEKILLLFVEDLLCQFYSDDTIGRVAW